MSGGPLIVAARRVDAQSDDLAVAIFGEFGLQSGHVAQLGGADGVKSFGWVEQDGPTIPIH